ncbi:MAG: glycine zipper 2TM domain-containing protein [Nevskiaceae bacterium]|nr:MAG: glycine zipper 2TM domain-containing protein [Nevskiaceae bacterium]TBR71989.1 MAG: glycine zipper 2TM domain-containing protein [Nevskiaceae bacterium]
MKIVPAVTTTRLVAAGGWAAMLMLSACAYQQPYGQPYGMAATAPQPSPEDVQYVTAEVLSSTPAYQAVQVARPRQECAQVPVDSSGNTVVGTMVGGALGGLAGNQFGKGSGNAAMTALGAIAGAIAGNSVAHASVPPGATTTQCRTVTDYVTQRQADGYDVTYRYAGQVYHTHSDADPGATIRVRVAVSPAPGSY